jgi:DNA-directed RNA polymerase specialized sigma24 family protein
MGLDKPMQSVSANGITLINFGMGSAMAATMMDLLSAINQLNPTQKSLVLLKDYEGYSYQEIGEIMNLSESQVKVYLHRARLFLKTQLLELEKVNA